MQSLRLATRAPLYASSFAINSRTVPLRASSNISGGSMGRSWADKEHAEESKFFNKRDAELLAQLASKLQKQAAVRFFSCPFYVHHRTQSRQQSRQAY